MRSHFTNFFAQLSAAAGSFPNSALFFCVYETSKPLLKDYVGEANPARAQTIAGALGEVVSVGGEERRCGRGRR